MKFEKLEIPEFLLAEIPVKHKTIQDNRLWIYASKHLSLIEAYCKSEIDFEFPSNLVQNTFEYINSDGILEIWVLVLTQNNVRAINPDGDEYQVLREAFHFLETYMTWEDINIDFE